MRTILWSGGFDSTWLVVDALLREPGKVRTVTWRPERDDSWQKFQNEDAARRRIESSLTKSMRSRLVQHVERNNAVLLDLHNVWSDVYYARGGNASRQNSLHAVLPKYVGHVEVGHVKDDVESSLPTLVELLTKSGVKSPIVKLTKLDLLRDAEKRGIPSPARHDLEL